MIALRTKSAWRPILKSASTDIADAPAAVDQEGGATHADAERTIDPIHLDDFSVLVRQQRERQVVLRAKFGVRRGALRADAHDPQFRA